VFIPCCSLSLLHESFVRLPPTRLFPVISIVASRCYVDLEHLHSLIVHFAVDVAFVTSLLLLLLHFRFFGPVCVIFVGTLLLRYVVTLLRWFYVRFFFFLRFLHRFLWFGSDLVRCLHGFDFWLRSLRLRFALRSDSVVWSVSILRLFPFSYPSFYRLRFTLRYVPFGCSTDSFVDFARFFLRYYAFFFVLRSFTVFVPPSGRYSYWFDRFAFHVWFYIRLRWVCLRWSVYTLVVTILFTLPLPFTIPVLRFAFTFPLIPLSFAIRLILIHSVVAFVLFRLIRFAFVCFAFCSFDFVVVVCYFVVRLFIVDILFCCSFVCSDIFLFLTLLFIPPVDSHVYDRCRLFSFAFFYRFVTFTLFVGEFGDHSILGPILTRFSTFYVFSFHFFLLFVDRCSFSSLFSTFPDSVMSLILHFVVLIFLFSDFILFIFCVYI